MSFFKIKSKIITIGDEILIGQIVDTNSTWIAEQMTLAGFDVSEIVSVGDNKHQITNAINRSVGKDRIVIITGGLGPTSDDITKQVLAEYFDMKLVRNEEVLSDIKRILEGRNLMHNERNVQQADVPEGCEIIRNDIGTAAGMIFEKENTIFISMPAVPFEMKEMFGGKILPLLKERFKPREIIRASVQTFGIPESALAEMLNDWEKKLPENVQLAYLPSPERIRLRLSCEAENKVQAKSIIKEQLSGLESIIGQAIFGYGDVFLHEVLGDILKERGKTLSTGESCTGGNIARLITSVPGSSAYFEGSVVAYSNKVKNEILKVDNEILEKHGAVSEETVRAMINGLLNLFKTDYAIAVSGIAGPDGGTEEKPVGTIWIAVGSNEEIISKKFVFGKRRDTNIRLSSSKAMDMMRKFILGYYK